MHQKLTAKEHQRRAMGALLDHGDEDDLALYRRVARCGVDWNGSYPCRTAICIRCRWRNIRRETRNTFELLGHFQNEELAFVTIVLSGTGDINGVSAAIRKSRFDTANRFKAARSADARWHDTYLRAWHEIDCAGAKHIAILPPERKALVAQLAPMLPSVEKVWLTSYHALMFRNRLTDEEIATEFRKQWPHDNQVDVRPLRPKRSVQANLAGITSYANKHFCVTTLDGRVKEIWPLEWQREYFRWLNGGCRNQFERLRLTINQHVPVQPAEVCSDAEVIHPMPFIHSATSVPTTYITDRLP